MSVPHWVCLQCGKEFAPINGKGGFSFNCPSCGSPKTVVKRLAEARVNAGNQENSNKV